MYSGTDMLLGSGGLTAAQIDKVFKARNAAAPDGLGAAFVSQGRASGVNSDWLAGQTANESDWWKSKIAVDKNNPAGIGATNDNPYGNAITFRTPEAGIHAQTAHLLTWIKGSANPWAADDPRYQAAMSTGRAGHAITFNDLNGNWAFPGTNYGNDIAAFINTIIREAGMGVTGDFPTMSELGFAVRLEPQRLGYFGADRPLSAIRWWIQHCTEGYYEGDITTLTQTKDGSVHFIIGKEWGQLTASVPIKTTAWTPGNNDVAAQSVNVEMSGFADGREGGFTDWQYFCNGVIFRWCQSAGMGNVPVVYIGRDDADGGPEPDDAGILGHQDVPDPYHPGQWGGAYHHTDPGPTWDWNRMIAAIVAAPSPVPHPLVHVVDGIELGEGFYQLYAMTAEDTAARLREYGKLIRGDYDAWLSSSDGGVIPIVAAMFERGPLVWDRRVAAPWDIHRPLYAERVLDSPPKTHAHLVAATKYRGNGKQGPRPKGGK
jgi:N-acetyl-anhydromuramyl-L-alanine amidase AmpD